LKFYASQAAISAYISYTKLRKEQSPDEQHDYIKESFVFIANFCKDKNIKFKDYTKFKSVAQNDCLIHLKEHKISWYTVFDIPGFYELLYNLPEDEFQLYFGKVSLHDINIKLKSSNSTKELIKNCTDRVNDFLRKKA
jgi:hypothetical protein